MDFLTKSLETLHDQLTESTKAIKQFQDAIKNAKGDLSGVDFSSASKKSKGGMFTKARDGTTDKQAAAQTLFNLLGGSGVAKPPAGAPPGGANLFGAASAAESTAKAGKGGKGGKGPKMGLSLGGEEEGTAEAAPKGLPTAPGLPKGAPGLPSAPPGPPKGLTSAPSFPGAPPGASKAKGPPPLPGGAPGMPPAPPNPPSMPGPPAAPGGDGQPAAGGAFKSLRDEMLSELNRLKKIMGGAK